MKMSDVFFERIDTRFVPLSSLKSITRSRDIPIELSVTPYVLNHLNIKQMLAIEHAVNNHDALVEALESVAHDSMIWSEGRCSCCNDTSHADYCAYKAAINLLDKINGESNG